jgi:predicted transcriptional regulator
MTKRSKHEILAEILTICQKGANKTRIVYQANLNFSTVGPHLKTLTANGYIVMGEDRIYRSTPAGERYLEQVKGVLAVF